MSALQAKALQKAAERKAQRVKDVLKEETKKAKEQGMSALEAKIAAQAQVKAAAKARAQAMASSSSKAGDERAPGTSKPETLAASKIAAQVQAQAAAMPGRSLSWTDKEKLHSDKTQAAVEAKLRRNGLTPELQKRLLSAQEAPPPPKEEESQRKEIDAAEMMRRRAARAAEQRRQNRDREIGRLQRAIKDDDKAWAAFEALAAQGEGITAADVPEPEDGVLSCDGAEVRADRFKVLAKRWHPDRFFNRFSAAMKGDERDAIEAKVQGIFQALNEYKYICLC